MVFIQQSKIEEIQKMSKKYGYDFLTGLCGYWFIPIEGNKIFLDNDCIRINEAPTEVREFEIVLRKKLKETFDHNSKLRKEYLNSKFSHIIK
jgi:hypothetical protein